MVEQCAARTRVLPRGGAGFPAPALGIPPGHPRAPAAAAAIYVVLLLPTNATMPSELGHAKVSVETSYPFGDEVTVRVAATSTVQLFVRVPEWATAATVSLNGASPTPAKSNAYHLVSCAADATSCPRV